MISLDLRVQGLDPEHIANLFRLLHPPAGGDPAPGGGAFARLAQASAPTPASRSALSPRMPAIVLCRDERVLRIFQLGGGVLPSQELASSRPEDLRAFRKRLGLPFVLAVEIDELPRLFAELQGKVSIDDDYLEQGLAVLPVLRDALGQSLRLEPRLFPGTLPLPSYSLLRSTWNAILPDGRSLVFYLCDGGRLWTSLILVKRGGEITQIATHAAIADRVRFASIRGDARAVLAAVADRFAPAAIGIFLPLRVWHELVAGDRSAAARALASRQAVLDPAPPWLLALVGVGAMAEAATRSVRLAGRLLGATRLGGLFPGGAGAAEKLLQTVASPLEALGIDPWELLRWSRDWARRIELDRQSFQSR
jgi:hypothetical protein